MFKRKNKSPHVIVAAPSVAKPSKVATHLIELEQKLATEQALHDIHLDVYLSKFPHILEKVKLFWGTQDLWSYVTELGIGARDGKRQGLPPDVMRALIRAADINADRLKATALAKLNLPTESKSTRITLSENFNPGAWEDHDYR